MRKEVRGGARLFMIAVVVVFLVSACAPMFANYHQEPLDKYVDQDLINAPVKNPNRTFWVSEYQHNGRTQSSLLRSGDGLINLTPKIRANVTLFVKEAIKKQFPNAIFVSDANKADTAIVIKNFGFYASWMWQNVELKSDVNGKEIVFKERLYSKDFNSSEKEESDILKKLASILVEKIKGMGIKETSH